MENKGASPTSADSMTLRTQLHSFFFFQAEDGIRDTSVTGVQTCALPISEIAAQDVADPDAELLPDRQFEAELLADRRDLVGGGVVARNHRRRIARRQSQHQRSEERRVGKEGRSGRGAESGDRRERIRGGG